MSSVVKIRRSIDSHIDDGSNAIGILSSGTNRKKVGVAVISNSQ